MLLAFFVSGCLATDAPPDYVKVIKVVDGDTVHIRQGGETIKVRLLCIDAPERNQAFGNAARKHLAGMVAGEYVRVEGESKDRYGRLLAKLYHDESEGN